MPMFVASTLRHHRSKTISSIRDKDCWVIWLASTSLQSPWFSSLSWLLPLSMLAATEPQALKLSKLITSVAIWKNYSPPPWVFKVLFIANQATSPFPFLVNLLALDRYFTCILCCFELDQKNRLKLDFAHILPFHGMSVGAVARITCLKVDKHGYEMGSYSFLSGASDEKGYFFATLYPSEVEDDCYLKECKAFLESSPVETCDVPTDDNNGISGHPLEIYRSLSSKKMMLYSLKPFFFIPNPEPVSNGY